MRVGTTQLNEGDWLGLIDHILQELRERFGPSGVRLPGATMTFLCEALSAILLRFYRGYSMEKLCGKSNSRPNLEGAVKDAIEQDNLEMSFEAVSAFADCHGHHPIENVRGNRAQKLVTGNQFFDCIWGDRPHEIPRTHWDTAVFRQQYHRIRNDLNIPGPVQQIRELLERTLKYRFFQSQTVFSYPDFSNGTLASTSNGARKVWYHQTQLPYEHVVIQEVERVKRCNENPRDNWRLPGEQWKPRRLPKIVQSWELVILHCRAHGLHFTSQ